ncbi:hypothetical protein D0865_12885 [Hortaea werneckii]|uniref:DUF7918 domain-containing protein n=1 Tax=Hortaea werneckii TaxID=91943 RepID=A0A3M7BHL7_HORWE|nr:hypothetical protein D0865_12885 [Hortaea werneckii]
MYDEEAGIEVFVRPYDSDTAYREYRAPRSSPLYTGQKNERYIEAVNDERFEVVVKLEPAFDFKMYTGVKVCTNIDGGGISCHTILANPKRKVESRIVLRECFSYEGHEWQCVGFCFREAKALEDGHLTSEEEEHETSKRGRIEVGVQLGRWEWINSKLNSRHNHALPEGTSKKVAVDKGRSHTVAPSDQRAEGEQTNNDQSTESRNEEAAPVIVITGLKFPKKPKEIVKINLDSHDEEQPPSKKIKKESTEGVHNPSTGTATRTPANSTAKNSKDKKRARIESRLEEIRLQREEHRLRRQMMDLEDGE